MNITLCKVQQSLYTFWHLNQIILPLEISTYLKQFYIIQYWNAIFTDHDKNIVES